MAQAEITARPGESPARRPRLLRSRHDRFVSGTAAGIGAHLGADPSTVRIAFIALSLVGGFGVVVYLLIWLLTPSAPEEEGAVVPANAPPPSVRFILATALAIGGVLVLVWIYGFWLGEFLAWPAALATVGSAVLWARNADDGERWRPSSLRSPIQALMTGEVPVARIAIGGGSILGGLGILLAANTSVGAAASVIVAVVVTIVGVGLLAGPWVWGVGRELVEERASRIRSEARAEMAAHLHDSVLQTLALIQRAREPREMATLARTQERELRAWLYGRAPTLAGAGLRDALDDMAGRIERRQQVNVEVVVVGEAKLDERLRALVSATSEATMNAARHSGAPEVSVFVEVETDTVTAFVRDQGIGFDPEAVPGDRKGIAGSMRARMERHGGSVEINSRPEQGTEVILRLPRRAA